VFIHSGRYGLGQPAFSIQEFLLYGGDLLSLRRKLESDHSNQRGLVYSLFDKEILKHVLYLLWLHKRKESSSIHLLKEDQSKPPPLGII
jgi:hypothetical protein